MVELLPVGIALFGSAVAGMVAHRVGLPLIPAYILAGAALGPLGFAVVERTQFLEAVSELGVIFLLLFLGLEFRVTRFIASGRQTLVAGGFDFLFNFPVGLAIGLVAGLSVFESFLLGGILYVTSSGIVVKGLIDLRRLANRETEILLGVLVFEDIVMAVFLAVMSGIAALGAVSAGSVAVATAKAVLFSAVYMGLAYAMGPRLDRFLRVRKEEVFFLLVMAVVLGSASIAELAGLSPAVGAFFAGLLFSDSYQATHIKERVVPLRDLFAALFFFMFGTNVDVRTLASVGLLLVAAVPLSILAKLIAGAFIGELFRLSKTGKLNLGAALVPRGEFSVIAAQLAIPAPTPAAITAASVVAPFTGAYVFVMSILGPVLMEASPHLARVLERADRSERSRLL